MTTKAKTLKSDYGRLCYDYVNKTKFLRHAASYMRAVGKVLETLGFEDVKVRKNPAGDAVSGEVYLDAKRSGGVGITNIHAWICETCLETSREDHLALVAHTVSETGQRGRNNWLSLNSNSEELAYILSRISE